MRWTLVLLATLGCDPDPVKDSAVDTDTDLPDTDTVTDTDTTPPGPVGCDVPGTICRGAGSGARGLNGPQKADAVWLNLPTAIAFEADGRPIFADYENHMVRRIEATQDVVTLAGYGFHSYAEEGPAVASPLENPIDVARCGTNLFLAEQHGTRILMVDAFGNLWVVAGQVGTIGYAGDGGPATAALMSEITGVACDDDGTLYIADFGNNAIRMVDPYGIISTLAGSAVEGHADGPADQALFASPQDVVLHDGALYVAEWRNHTIRRIDLDTREVTTVAGTPPDGTQPQYGFSGDGGPAVGAKLNFPTGVALAEDGTLYIADSTNHVIRRVKPDGVIDTVAGTAPVGGVPQSGFDGDGAPGLEAHLALPYGVAVAPDGKVWIADTQNSVLRVLTPPE